MYFVFPQTSQLPDFRKIGDAMIEFNKSDSGIFHLSTDYHINRVKKGGYAWIGKWNSGIFHLSTDYHINRVKNGGYAWIGKWDSGIFHLSTDFHINRAKKGGYAWIGKCDFVICLKMPSIQYSLSSVAPYARPQ